ncbi:MAG: hypothetical protein JSS70_12685 [Bacteroidetes bacterium]|nr:hypothetical protein [Bacteroidota bacterium]
MKFTNNLLSFFFIICSVPALSQAGDNINNRELSKKNLGFSVIHLVTQKSRIYGDKSLYNLGSKPQIGIEFLINYYYDFTKKYTVVFDIGAGVLSHSFSYLISKDLFDPAQEHNVGENNFISRQLDITFLKGGVELQRKFEAALKSKWVVAAGIDILYSTGGSIGSEYSLKSSNGTQQVYLATADDYSNNNKPWLNYHLSAGREWIANQGRIFQVLLKASYSSSNFFSGTYKFTVGNQPDVNGRYAMSGSYIGLSFSYIFSRYKNIKEKSNH